MSLQESISTLQKELTQQDELIQSLNTQSEEAIRDWKYLSSEQLLDEASLQDLVAQKTQLLQTATEDLRDTQTALLHAQKMESVGELATGMAHEINTPLQYIGGNLEFMQHAFDELTRCLASAMNLLEESGIDENPLAERKKKIDFVMSRLPNAITQSKEGVENVSRIVRAMRRFSHISEDRVEADLNDALESTLTVSRGEWKYVADIELETDPNLPKLVCLPGDLNQVFLNLIVNSAHALEQQLGSNPKTKGVITIRTAHDEQNIYIEISDTGCGIPQELKGRIFDQFFTTKEVGKGTGQGLSICWSIIVDKHGGAVDMQSEVDAGTTFRVSLPRDWRPEGSAASEGSQEVR